MLTLAVRAPGAVPSSSATPSRARSTPRCWASAPGALLWGHDGSVEVGDGGARAPPFEAPFTHALDHPDYVLITLSEAAGGHLAHAHHGERRHVFCKLSLYPLFREERMLPRDSTLLHSNFGRFEIAFWNRAHAAAVPLSRRRVLVFSQLCVRGARVDAAG